MHFVIIPIKRERECVREREREIPMVRPGRLTRPFEVSKNTSREEDAKSSKIDVKAGGSRGLPFAIYIALKAYLEEQKKFSVKSNISQDENIIKNKTGLP